MGRAEVDALADEVLRETLGSVGFHHATVSERADEDSFYINVHFDPQPTTVDDLPVLTVVSELRKRLLAREEERFPYVRYILPDAEPLNEEADAPHA